MPLDFLGASKYRFSGRAGELQEANATASLIGELGDNYAAYHAEIVAAFKDVGGIPAPGGEGTLENFTMYCNQWAEVQSLVIAEMALRRARQIRLGLTPARIWELDGPPIVDPSGSLTAATDTAPVGASTEPTQRVTRA
jgi:hypothetical protein